MNLTDHPLAVVTGGGRNLGRQIALRLAHQGADVAVMSPDSEDLERVVSEIHGLGRRAHAAVVDITSEEEVRAGFAEIRHALGPIEILVNNAGIAGPTARIDEIAYREWQECLDVNLTGAFLCSQAVAAEMIERRCGKIINISSVAGKIGYPLRAPYAASKWGLIGLSLTLSKELGPFNVQVNTICPGPIQGPRIDAVIRDRAQEMEKSEEEVRQIYLSTMSLGRMVTMKDVADMVAYLASQAGDNISGQAIDVSAGYDV